MSYRLLASSCDDGPCGTFYVHDETGDVLVQGYHTTERPPAPVPTGEGLLRIHGSTRSPAGVCGGRR